MPALIAGVYSVMVSANGFKQAVIKSVKIDAGIPASVNATLEVGATTDTVVVQGGAEVMQTQAERDLMILNQFGGRSWGADRDTEALRRP